MAHNREPTRISVKYRRPTPRAPTRLTVPAAAVLPEDRYTRPRQYHSSVSPALRLQRANRPPSRKSSAFQEPATRTSTTGSRTICTSRSPTRLARPASKTVPRSTNASRQRRPALPKNGTAQRIPIRFLESVSIRSLTRRRRPPVTATSKRPLVSQCTRSRRWLKPPIAIRFRGRSRISPMQWRGGKRRKRANNSTVRI